MRSFPQANVSPKNSKVSVTEKVTSGRSTSPQPKKITKSPTISQDKPRKYVPKSNAIPPTPGTFVPPRRQVGGAARNPSAVGSRVASLSPTPRSPKKDQSSSVSKCKRSSSTGEIQKLVRPSALKSTKQMSNEASSSKPVKKGIAFSPCTAPPAESGKAKKQQTEVKQSIPKPPLYSPRGWSQTSSFVHTSENSVKVYGRTDTMSDDGIEDDEPPKSTPSRDIGLRSANLVVESSGADEGGMRFVLFLEKTQIEWTPELDHIAEGAYYLARDPTFNPFPCKDGHSGYNYNELIKEEDAPPEPPSQGGWFGDVLMQRRKRMKWEAHIKWKGERAAVIQALARRYLARLEYHEVLRLKGLDLKRQRIRDMEVRLFRIPSKTKADIEALRKDYEVKRAQLKDIVFDDFKQYGRQLMEETRALGQALPGLRKESKRLKAEQISITEQIEKAHASTMRLHETSLKLKRVIAEYQMMADHDVQELEESYKMGMMESRLKQIFDAGIQRLISRIDAAASKSEPDLVESIKAMNLDCRNKIAAHTPVPREK